MNKLLFTFFLLVSGMFCLYAQLPAFPGAEGWGMYTKGGRGGIVIEVTNLNDSGAGSFREAVMNPNPRIVIFKVSGTIELKSEIIITSPYLTLAGQTAPGDGICLKNYPLDIRTQEVIIRGIRVRPGIESGLIGSELDAMEVSDSHNIIVDHCSFSFSNDEGINNWKGSSNITFQWCLMSDPLNKSVHEKGAHGFSASIGGNKASFHHNILANGAGRNPSIGGNNQFFTVLLDIRNCLISNWEHRTCDGKPLSVNLINNYYKPGPATKESVKKRIAKIDNSEHLGFSGLWFIEGNYMEGYPEISANNWNGGVDLSEGVSKERNRQLKPFTTAPVITQSSEDAYKLLLDYAGCIAPKRDSQDERVINQIRTGKYLRTENGIIDNVEQAGGWPILNSVTPPIDSDGDGIPDEWEKANGLNPNDSSDAIKIAANGYMNIENYINSLIPIPYN